MEIYKFTVKDRKGNDVSLADYKGKVLLIVNTATRCGFTPQYTELEALYEKYSAKGFEILDFPCNQFGQQAPGTEEEIHEFCQLNYKTKFPQFKKIDVNGDNQSPLFAYLKSQKGFKGFDPNHKIGKILIDMLSKADPDYDKNPDIKWNFTKFLIDRNGNVVERFEPTEDINVIEKAMEKLM
ncbi:MAG: glutathione peroxidase [Bacteroidales bacterium]|nr:glutathione peroxidase [Bacteroidales bacterium]